MRTDLKSTRTALGAVAALGLTTLVVHFLAQGSTAVLANPALPKPGPRASFLAQDGTVSLVGYPDRTAVLAGGNGEVKLELILSAASVEPTSEVPTDFIVVLDRSGSMGGEKIVKARAAVGEIIGQLSPRDRFALIAYSSVAEVSIALSSPSAEARRSWRRRVATIEATGGTNMSQGLDLALKLVNTHRRGACRLILISDGLANEGDHSFDGLTARALRTARAEAVLSTIGVGTDFDEFLMSALADRGTGNFYYLADGVQLAEVFAREFEAGRETVASAVEVTLEPAAGVSVVDAAGYFLEIDRGRATFRPGSLFAGQERHIWVTLKVPSEAGEHRLGRIRLAYRRDGHPHELVASRSPVVRAVLEEDDFLNGVDKDRWSRAVLEEDFSRLRQRVAAYVKEGRKNEALQELHSYRHRNQALNRSLQSPEVDANMVQVENLEAQVEDAFAGEGQAHKQNLLSKSNQAAAWDQRRAGAKKTGPQK